VRVAAAARGGASSTIRQSWSSGGRTRMTPGGATLRSRLPRRLSTGGGRRRLGRARRAGVALCTGATRATPLPGPRTDRLRFLMLEVWQRVLDTAGGGSGGCSAPAGQSPPRRDAHGADALSTAATCSGASSSCSTHHVSVDVRRRPPAPTAGPSPRTDRLRHPVVECSELDHIRIVSASRSRSRPRWNCWRSASFLDDVASNCGRWPRAPAPPCRRRWLINGDPSWHDTPL